MVAMLAAAGLASFIDLKCGYRGTDMKLELFDPDIHAVLEVYGNVNEDDVIDEKDIELLDEAISTGTSKDYRYADADFDGKVDRNDIDFIRKIMDATFENPVKVRHLNRYTEGDYYTESMIPMDNVAISASANILTMFKHIGINSQIKAVAFNSGVEQVLLAEYQYLFCDKTFDPGDDSKYRVGGSAGYFAKESLVRHITADHLDGLITADNAKSYLAGPSSTYPYGMTEKEVKDLNLSVIRIAPASTDFSVFLSDMAMLCFAFGISSEKIEQISSWLIENIGILNDKIDANVGDGKIRQLGTAVSSSCSYSEKGGKITTYNYVSSRASDYTGAILGGGGKFAMDGYDFKGSSSS